MAGAGRGFGLLLLILLVGGVIGSFLGEVLVAFLPAGWWQDLLTKGPTVGLVNPATLDLKFLSVTLGVTIKVNLVAVLGLLIATIALRRL